MPMDMQVPFKARRGRPINPVLAVRNREICDRYAAGETLAAIGRSFSISSERVRKILKKSGLDKSNGGLAIRNQDKPRKPLAEPYCVRVYGCPAGKLEKFTLKERQAFLQQRTNVKRTKVPWLLTLPEWSDIWFRSGKWARRGQGPYKYGLYRIDSGGAFSAENVVILKNSRSAREKLRAASEPPTLEFRRAAWVLARLKAALAENCSAPPHSATASNALEESARPKYWEHAAGTERERLDVAESRDE